MKYSFILFFKTLKTYSFQFIYDKIFFLCINLQSLSHQSFLKGIKEYYFYKSLFFFMFSKVKNNTQSYFHTSMLFLISNQKYVF